MDTDNALLRCRQWAKQTIAFTLTMGNPSKTKVPLEQLEIMGHRAEVIAKKLLDEAVARCNGDTKTTITTLVKSVLDWVVKNHRPE